MKYVARNLEQIAGEFERQATVEVELAMVARTIKEARFHEGVKRGLERAAEILRFTVLAPETDTNETA